MTAIVGAEPHITAIAGHLSATPLTTHVGEAPAGSPRPYLVIWPQPGTLEGTLGDRHRDLLLTFTVTAVGDTPESALIYHDRARDRLLSGPPTVAGRTVQPLWLLDPGPGLQRDDDVDPHLFYLPAVYRLRSEPSA